MTLKTMMPDVEVIKHFRSDPEDKTKQTDEFLEYEFRIGGSSWYRQDLDVGRLTAKMLSNGFSYAEVQPVINEVIRQFAELQAPPEAPKPNGRGKKPSGDDPEGSDDPPASA